MNRKEEIYQVIKKYTSELKVDSFIGDRMLGLDATTISIDVGMKRNNVSKELNILEREKKIIRVNSKPALFLDLSNIEILLNKKIPEKFMNIKYIKNELKRTFKTNQYDLTISELDTLIGAKSSLSVQVEEAKAAIIYPPFGLHTFLVGETGVGKTMFAECMFHYGMTKGRFKEDAPFIAFNCADYAENTQLLLAQLFGYVKGAFTGADSEKEGIIQKANHGMLLLDEVHRLPHEGQEMLFYFLDKGAYRRLGETNVFHKAEVLVVAATTEKIDSNILKTFSRRIPMLIKIPSLEDRTLDERMNLIKHFFYKEAKKIKVLIKVSGEVMHVLLLYKCVGNIGQLESDIKLICAKAFLNWKENLENEIYIKYDLLPNQIKQNLIQQDYFEKLQIINHHNVFLKSYFLFDFESNLEVSEQLISNKIHLFIKNINNICANNVNHLDLQIKKEFIKRIQNLVDDFWTDLQDSIYNIQELFYKKVDNKIIVSALKLSETLSREKIDYKLTQKVLVIFCLLLDYASKNEIKTTNYNLYNSQIGSKKEHFIITNIIEELEATISFSSKIRECLYLLLLIHIKTTSLIHKSNVDDNHIEVIIISHGSSTASSMLLAAQNILNIQAGFAIDIPIYSDYTIVADKIEKRINEVDKNSDILLLVDFVNMAVLGDYIMHKTGRSIKIVTNVTTQIVIEGLKNAYLSFLSLDRAAELLENITPNKTLASYHNSRNDQLILVTCVSGYGTAQKIADWVGSMDILKHNGIDTVPIGEFEFDMIEDKNILAVIGTIDLGLVKIPFISLEELILGTGIAKLVDIIKGDSCHDNSIIIEDDIEEITLAALNRLLEFCDAKKLFNFLDLTIKNLENNCQPYSNNIYLRFITHTACMVERLIKNISFVHNKAKSVLKKYDNIYQNLKNSLTILEDIYGIRIPDEEYAYIIELLNDEK